VDGKYIIARSGLHPIELDGDRLPGGTNISRKNEAALPRSADFPSGPDQVAMMEAQLVLATLVQRVPSGRLLVMRLSSDSRDDIPSYTKYNQQ